MKILPTLFVAAALAAAGCAAPITSHGEYLHTAPFADFRTFSFAPAGGALEGYETTPRSAQIVEAMKPFIRAELVRKGWVEAPGGDGDVVVACAAGRREVTKMRRLPWRMTMITGEETEERDFVEGGIVIDAFDRSGGQIWHGAARTEIDPNHPSLDRLEIAVDAALAHFPAKR